MAKRRWSTRSTTVGDSPVPCLAMIREIKKGAGASPLLSTDPPKTRTQSRLCSGHPGKPIFLFAGVECKSDASAGSNRRFEFIRLKQWELARREPFGEVGGTPRSYKISQIPLRAPPFFGRRRHERHGRKKNASTANRSADRRCNGLTKSLHIGCVLGFDHHTRQGLRAGVTQHDASVIAKR